jgi:hypothetical protein
VNQEALSDCCQKPIVITLSFGVGDAFCILCTKPCKVGRPGCFHGPMTRDEANIFINAYHGMIAYNKSKKKVAYKPATNAVSFKRDGGVKWWDFLFDRHCIGIYRSWRRLKSFDQAIRVWLADSEFPKETTPYPRRKPDAGVNC